MTDVNGQIDEQEINGSVGQPTEVSGSVSITSVFGSISSTSISGNVSATEISATIEGGILNENDFVPYVGAIKNTDLGSYNLTTIGYIQADTMYASNFVFTTGDIDLYIATDGDDSTGDGTSDNPWATPAKLVEQMALYRTDGNITGHIANGTYTNPDPDSTWLRIPLYALGNWKIIGNNSWPANVILDGDDEDTSQATMFHNFNNLIRLKLQGMTLKNARVLVNSTGTMELQNVNFDNYKYAVNLADGAVLKSYGGGYADLNFNGNPDVNSAGFRMINDVSVVITENISMTNNCWDFALTGNCKVKIESSAGSTYESTLSPTGRNAINVSRESAFECNMDMTLDGGGDEGEYAIRLTTRSRFYSFTGHTHHISNYSIAGWYMGVGVVVNEPYGNNWYYDDAGSSGILADYSVFIETADNLDTTITWNNYGDVIGFDKHYPIIEDDSGAPGSTPDKVGDTYIDTSGGKVYIATGTSNSSDWKILN